MNQSLTTFVNVVKNRNLLASLTFHIACAICLLMFGKYSIIALQSNVFKALETDSIDIEILSPKQTKKPKEKPVTIKEEIKSNDALEPLPIEASSPVNDAPKEFLKSKPKYTTKEIKEITKYEQILSKHFADKIIDLPKSLIHNDRIFIWLKIDNSGSIRDYGFQPATLENEITEQLETLVAISNPVPPPPSSDNPQVRQYLIPIKFR